MRFNPRALMGGTRVRLRAERRRGGSPGARAAGRRVEGLSFQQRAKRAFTLLELLVVMAIIGILATIGLPSLSGLGGSLDIDSAHRQLLDDLSYARLKAISERTHVYVAFVPPNIVDAQWNNLPEDQMKELRQLLGLQYRGYALFTARSLGDQPGGGVPHYLTEWRSLPEGVFISPHEFQLASSETARLNDYVLTNRPFGFFPLNFPTAKSPVPNAELTAADITKYIPCVVFDYQGRLVSPRGGTPTDEYITLTQGSIIYATDNQDRYELSPAEVIETPPGNYTNNPAIHIDWLTGRARTVLPGGAKG